MDSGRDKRYLKYFIAPLAVSLIVLFIGVYINRSKPDIRFSLSGGLPREILGETSTENVQLLEIRNTGKEEAHRLTIKIKTSLTFYKIKKFFEGDKVEEFLSDKGLEIIYPSLPPEGVIKVILQSKTTIEKSEIDVSHSGGKGEEAFASGTSSPFSVITISILLIYGVGFLTFILLGITSAKDHLESQSSYDFDAILLRAKPMFINNRRWNLIRAKAIKSKIKHKYGDIDKTESYKVLCLPGKIDYLTEEEWLSLQYSAIEVLTDLMITRLNTASYPGTILDLVNISKPSSYPEKEWIKLQNKLNESYITLKVRTASFSRHPSTILYVTQ